MMRARQPENLSSAALAYWYPASEMSIAENLKRIRKQRGLSQTALADKAGVGQQLISQIETGANTTTKKLPDLARSLGCAIHELDPSYGGDVAQDDPLMAKVSHILQESDEAQLQLLDTYLDFLLSRTKKPGEGSQ